MIKIIAVDDEPAFNEMLCIYMEDFGDFKISAYTSPKEAFERIIAGDVDAIITDYFMEEMDGISFIRKVKSVVPEIPAVLLTARDDREIILKAMDAGTDFIQFKSEEPSRLFAEIAQKITNAVERYRAKQDFEKGSKTRELMMRTQRDLMERLSASSTTNQALDATLTAIRYLTGCTSGSIHLIQAKTNKFELAISHNLPNDQIKRFTFGDLYKVVYSKKSGYYTTESGTNESEQMISGGQIPIQSGTDVVGVLSFMMDKPQKLPSDFRNTLELLTGYLGSTLIRIHSEEQVRHRERELSELYQAMQELVIVIDMDGTILSVNPATTRTLAYTEEELVGMPVQILFSPAIRDEVIFQFMDITGTGGFTQNTFPLLNKKGDEIPVETRGTTGMWGGRNVLFCISREIGERLEAERNMHEYYERISAILASSAAQIYMKDTSFRYLMGNSPFCLFVHTDPHDLIGKTDEDFFSSDIADKRRKTDSIVISRDVPIHNIEEEMIEDGEHRWFVSSKIPVHDQSGTVTGLVGTSLDITDLVNTREELERRDRILSAISTVAQSLVRNDEWEPIIPDYLELLGLASGVEQVILIGMNLYDRPGFEDYYCEWVMPDEKGDKISHGSICQEIFPSFYKYLSKNRFFISDRKKIAEELGIIESESIPSFLLMIPVFISDTLWGTLAMMAWKTDYILRIAEIEALVMASEVIGSAISRYQTEELFHKPVEQSLVGVYLIQDSHFVYTNPRLSEILGCSREELDNSPVTAFIYPDDIGMVTDNHERLNQNPDMALDYEFRGVTRDGRVIWMENLITGILYKGKPAVLGSIMDITVRKQAEESIRLSLKEKDILLREVHHRVKNNMQIIVSMLRIQSSMFDNPTVFDVLQESKNRILSMAIVHEKLYRTDNLVSINLLEYISSLANTLITDFSPDEPLITLDLICNPAIEMTIDAGIPLGLIMNELITNSFKHGFQPQKKGTISITIVTDEAGFLDITYRDTGKGLPLGFDMEASDTLGMQIISNLIFQSSGEISFQTDNGAVVHMKIPVNEGFIIGGSEHATGE